MNEDGYEGEGGGDDRDGEQERKDGFPLSSSINFPDELSSFPQFLSPKC